MVKLSLQELRQIRSYSQCLDKSHSTVDSLISQLVGLQSQELPSASLAIRARTHKLELEDVKSARETERSIVLTWAMRGTLHLIHCEDAFWLSRLLNPILLHESKRRFAELKLDEDTLKRANKLIHDSLDKNGMMTRSEIANALAPESIPVAGQGIAHILRYAVLTDQICFGSERNSELTYVLAKDWLKAEKINLPKNPLAELGRRYLHAYAPATVQDFATWSGLPMKDAKETFADLSPELKEVDVEGQIFWVLRAQKLEKLESVRLLPRYDNYWLAYRNRDLLIDKAFAKEVHPGGGLIHPAIAISGEGKGSWRLEQKRGKVIIMPFDSFAPATIPLIEAEVEDIGSFLKQTIQIQIKNP